MRMYLRLQQLQFCIGIFTGKQLVFFLFEIKIFKRFDDNHQSYAARKISKEAYNVNQRTISGGLNFMPACRCIALKMKICSR